jgi:hypothetical protein
MAESFHSRIPTLPDAELRQVLEKPLGYRSEIVLAAVTELGRRGQPVSAEEWSSIRARLEERDAKSHATIDRQFVELLGDSLEARLRRIHAITACLLAAGLAAAVVVFVRAEPDAPNPLGYDPSDYKKYLREVELYGGKANLLAGELNRWFAGLWHGRPLAFTVGALTLVACALFWLVCSRQARALK